LGKCTGEREFEISIEVIFTADNIYNIVKVCGV